jgi:hypothetical protein
LVISFNVGTLLPTHCKCKVLLLHLMTISDTYTLGRTTLNEESAHRKDLELYNTKHSQETDINAHAWFEPAIPASEWRQTHALDGAATGIEC